MWHIQRNSEDCVSVKEKEGLTNEEVAKRFGVGKESVSRWKSNPDPVFKRNRPAQIVIWKP